MNRTQPLTFHSELHGYSVEFSPFPDRNGSKLACAASQHYGLVGNGRLLILDVTLHGINLYNSFDTLQCLYDCTWSESNDSHVLGASIDGSLKLWDIHARNGRPLRVFHEHSKEVYSVDWSSAAPDRFLSASWDRSIKLWSPDSLHSIATWAEHEDSLYSVVWSPVHADRFATTSGDRTIKLWDIREQRSAMTIVGHTNEVLTCDWNKYDSFVILSGSVDRSIRVWDIRNPRKEIVSFFGHNYAVRRLKCSPHLESVFASCSYDMSVVIWDMEANVDPMVERREHHSEFVAGIDFDIFCEGRIASCAWDETIAVWDSPLGPPPRSF